MKLLFRAIGSNFLPVVVLLSLIVLIIALIIDLFDVNSRFVAHREFSEVSASYCGSFRSFEGQKKCLSQLFEDAIKDLENQATFVIQNENLFWTKWNTINAFAISFITAVSIFILNKTLRESTRATNAINLANFIQQDTAFNSVRPWIVMEFGLTNDFQISVDSQSLTGEISIRATLTNSGNSIATELACLAEYKFEGDSFNEFEKSFINSLPHKHEILRNVGRILGSNASNETLFSNIIARPVCDLKNIRGTEGAIDHIGCIVACAYTSPLKENTIFVTYIKALLMIDEKSKSLTKQSEFKLSISDVYVSPIRYYQISLPA